MTIEHLKPFFHRHLSMEQTPHTWVFATIIYVLLLCKKHVALYKVYSLAFVCLSVIHLQSRGHNFAQIKLKFSFTAHSDLLFGRHGKHFCNITFII